MISGTISYRQRIPLTPHAVVSVALEDVSRMDASAVVLRKKSLAVKVSKSRYHLNLLMTLVTSIPSINTPSELALKLTVNSALSMTVAWPLSLISKRLTRLIFNSKRLENAKAPTLNKGSKKAYCLFNSFFASEIK